jgi:hypothetical protein
VTGQKLKIRQGKTIQILNESTLNTTETNEEYGCNVHKYQNSLMQSNNIAFCPKQVGDRTVI